MSRKIVRISTFFLISSFDWLRLHSILHATIRIYLYCSFAFWTNENTRIEWQTIRISKISKRTSSRIKVLTLNEWKQSNRMTNNRINRIESKENFFKNWKFWLWMTSHHMKHNRMNRRNRINRIITSLLVWYV